MENHQPYSLSWICILLACWGEYSVYKLMNTLNVMYDIMKSIWLVLSLISENDWYQISVSYLFHQLKQSHLIIEKNIERWTYFNAKNSYFHPEYWEKVHMKMTSLEIIALYETFSIGWLHNYMLPDFKCSFLFFSWI